MTLEMVKTTNFYKTWTIYWLAVIPGLLVLGAAKNIGLEVAGLGDKAAASIITILAISNASSRLISGALSDKLGTLNVLKGQFVVTILPSYLKLPVRHSGNVLSRSCWYCCRIWRLPFLIPNLYKPAMGYISIWF